ncbi:MAG: VWA domain-containing protein [Myxococcales bacterium]|nr:VWA domain-containing protein [Myxococcales bacterium]MCB9705424.1 VWA domain-containing protein [Myxococcales bacterium]
MTPRPTLTYLLKQTPSRALLTILPALALSSGCSMGGYSSGDLGVTPGGVQDNRYARELIEDGQIPDETAFRAEGILSEHDLPFTKGDACTELLCPRAAVARHQPVDGGDPQLLVQLGFATSIDAESFERRPLNLALAVDISGSMSGEKLDSVKEALTAMVDQLDGHDRVALAIFDDTAELRLKSTVMDEGGRDELRDAIAALEVRGGTNIEAGLALAFEQVAPLAGDPTVEDRVMLLTDAQPNVGATGLDSFLGMTRFYAESSIGATVFGVGLDLGAELAQEISKVRGGNYFYLADGEAITSIFEDEFEYIVTPLAYDLEAQVTASAGWGFAEAYGAPLDGPSSELEIGASTLFLSQRGGGIGVALRPGEGQELPLSADALAEFDLSFLPRGADAPVVDTLAVPWQGGQTYAASFVTADDLGAFKMAVLIDEYLALRAAADYCDGELTQEAALAIVKAASERLGEVGSILADAALKDDGELMATLAENLEAGSSRCQQDYGEYNY